MLLKESDVFTEWDTDPELAGSGVIDAQEKADLLWSNNSGETDSFHEWFLDT